MSKLRNSRGQVYKFYEVPSAVLRLLVQQLGGTKHRTNKRREGWHAVVNQPQIEDPILKNPQYVHFNAIYNLLSHFWAETNRFPTDLEVANVIRNYRRDNEVDDETNHLLDELRADYFEDWDFKEVELPDLTKPFHENNISWEDNLLPKGFKAKTLREIKTGIKTNQGLF